MLNIHKIKQMNVDEMAEWLKEVTLKPCNVCDAPLCKEGYECSEGWFQWLMQEAEA